MRQTDAESRTFFRRRPPRRSTDATRRPRHPARIYAATEDDCWDTAFDYMDVADAAMSNGEFEAIDSLLEQIDASKLCPTIRCAVLVAVFRGSPKLTQYAALFDRIHASYAAEMGQEAATLLLKGLEPKPS